MSADLKIPVTDTGPGREAFAVTPSDSVNYSNIARALYVGTGGTVVLVTTRNTAVTFTGLASGTILPVWHQRVNSTGTTATNLVALA